jgi:hypothetical protein
MAAPAGPSRNGAKSLAESREKPHIFNDFGGIAGDDSRAAVQGFREGREREHLDSGAAVGKPRRRPPESGADAFASL